jgi:hypothetical protein
MGSDTIKYTKPGMSASNAYLPNEWHSAAVTALEMLARWQYDQTNASAAKPPTRATPSAILQSIADKFKWPTAHAKEPQTTTTTASSSSVIAATATTAAVAPSLGMDITSVASWSTPTLNSYSRLPFAPQNLTLSNLRKNANDKSGRYMRMYARQTPIFDATSSELNRHEVLSKLYARPWRLTPTSEAERKAKNNYIPFRVIPNKPTPTTKSDQTKTTTTSSETDQNHNFDEGDEYELDCKLGRDYRFDQWFYEAKADVLFSAALMTSATPSSSSSSSSSSLPTSKARHALIESDLHLQPLPNLQTITSHGTTIGTLPSIVGKIAGFFDIHMRRPGLL